MKTIHCTYGYQVHHLGMDPITAPPQITRQQMNKPLFFAFQLGRMMLFPILGLQQQTMWL